MSTVVYHIPMLYDVVQLTIVNMWWYTPHTNVYNAAHQ